MEVRAYNPISHDSVIATLKIEVVSVRKARVVTRLIEEDISVREGDWFEVNVKRHLHRDGEQAMVEVYGGNR